MNVLTFVRGALGKGNRFGDVAAAFGQESRKRTWLRLLLLAIAAGVTAHVVKLPTFQPTSLSQPNETPLR